jgi:hypothetical protein
MQIDQALSLLQCSVFLQSWLPEKARYSFKGAKTQPVAHTPAHLNSTFDRRGKVAHIVSCSESHANHVNDQDGPNKVV